MSTDLSATPPAQFSIGRVLGDTFGVLRVNLASCATVTVVYVLVWQIVVLLADDQTADEFNWWNFAVRELWTCIVGGLACAALIYVFLLTLSGGKPSLRDLIRGLSFAIPIMVVSFIVDLPIMVSALLGASDSGRDPAIAVQAVVAIMTYIVYVLWFVAAPAVVAEGLGALSALRRSVSLTADRRWSLFGLIFVGGVAFWALAWAVAIIANAVNVELEHDGPNIISWIGDYVLPAVTLVFWAALQTIVYCALRLTKEGASVQELARVFD